MKKKRSPEEDAQILLSVFRFLLSKNYPHKFENTEAKRLIKMGYLDPDSIYTPTAAGIQWWAEEETRKSPKSDEQALAGLLELVEVNNILIVAGARISVPGRQLQCGLAAILKSLALFSHYYEYPPGHIDGTRLTILLTEAGAAQLKALSAPGGEW